MDLFEFFNSRDIAEHCKNINHRFSSLESAYLVWLSNHHTIEQKHKAWQEIIEHYPDETLRKKWTHDKEETLHLFLKRYIRKEKILLKRFYKQEDCSVYSYSLKYHNDIYENNNLYFTFTDCLAVIKNEIQEQNTKPSKIKIVKRQIFSHATNNISKMTLLLNCNFEAIEIDDDKFDRTLNKFMDYWIMIPTPFKSGDIVIECDNDKESDPFILTWIPYWRKNEKGRDMSKIANSLLNGDGDFSDMQASYFAQDDNGEIFWSHGPTYLNLEYFRNELKGKQKLLLAVKNYIQGKIYLDDLLRSHSVLLLEGYTKDLRNCGKVDEIMINSGLK